MTKKCYFESVHSSCSRNLVILGRTEGREEGENGRTTRRRRLRTKKQGIPGSGAVRATLERLHETKTNFHMLWYIKFCAILSQYNSKIVKLYKMWILYTLTDGCGFNCCQIAGKTVNFCPSASPTFRSLSKCRVEVYRRGVVESTRRPMRREICSKRVENSVKNWWCAEQIFYLRILHI